uniref:Ubiquitin-like protease family profile domain-containing protein n=1 Tax=Brassica oleracea var. oleracea TaxID=109376 RepID=A0A0D2ZSX9_BRAOL
MIASGLGDNSSIEGRKYSTPTRVSLARLVMELERFENYPWGRVAFKVLIDSVKGKDISGCYTINGFAQALQLWVYTDLPELGANYGNPLPNNSSPPILAYKGRKGRIFFKEAILSQSESVNGTNTGRKSLPADKGPDVPADASSSKDKAPEPSLEKRDDALALCRAKSDRTRKLAASQQSPYTANSMAKVIILNKKLYPGYNPFAPIDKKKLKELADWLKTCPHYRTPLDKKPRTSRTRWYHILRTSLEWLEDCQWRFNYKDFKDSEPDQNGLGRRLPVNYTDSHWIAIWISIPKRHIVVWDSICSSISPEELDVVMERFLYMFPYLLVECASSDEQRAQYSLEPFTHERLTNIPQARAGDCGMYALKYIECHALGMPFSKKDFAKPNEKTMREKMAVGIFKELPDAHEFENKDNDANLGAYEG